MTNSAIDTKKPTLLDWIVGPALAAIFLAYIAVGGTPENEWTVSPGNALFGINVLAWGIALALAYRWPERSLLLRGLAWLSSRFPINAGSKLTLAWSVFFIFCGMLMFLTGAGLA